MCIFVATYVKCQHALGFLKIIFLNSYCFSPDKILSANSGLIDNGKCQASCHCF